jgi:dTDP-N-acetylfucosamine:lipid II N-acetylfucosaminyltransferase
MPFWKNKAYWFIWGADLYDRFYENKRLKDVIIKKLRAMAASRIKKIVTYLYGDYKKACDWFGCDAEYHEFLMYPSNLYKANEVSTLSNDYLKIMIGNSADPLNNHLEIFNALDVESDCNILIYAPLNYGDENYKLKVMEEGYKIFRNKFIPIEKIMPIDDYNKFINSIDIFIFNHPIQQAMGNIISALGFGKTVFLRKETSQWTLFEELGVDIGDTSSINKDMLLRGRLNSKNIDIIKKYFSMENYLNQLKKLL